jgi:hypothetical protein
VSSAVRSWRRPTGWSPITVTLFVLGLAIVAAYVAWLMYLMANGSYDTWGALLLGPVLFAVTLPALRRQAVREGDARVFTLLCAGLVLKLVAALARYYVGFTVYGGSTDAGSYHEWGVRLSARFRDLIFVTGQADLTSTRFMRVFTGAVYTVIGPTKLGGFLFFSWIGFLGLFLFYRAFAVAVPDGRRRTYLKLVFFLPSLLYWPSSIGKEAWMMLALGLAAYGVARFLRGAMIGVIPALIGVWMTGVVRPHVAAIFAIAAIAAYVIRPAPESQREIAVLIKAGVLVMLVLASGVLVQRTQEFLESTGVNEDQGISDTLQNTMFRTAQGGSEFQPSVLDSPFRAPLAGITVLFRPLLPEAGNFQGLLAAAEGTFLLGLTVFRWRWIWRAVTVLPRTPYLLLVVVFVGLFICGFSSIANFGILARQRVQVMPFYLVLLSVPPLDWLERRGLATSGGGEASVPAESVA